MKSVIQGVRAILGRRAEPEKEAIVIEKEEIEKILPHRGRMLLLDRVVITSNVVRGELTVTEAVCEGHSVLKDGKPALKGSDLLDMAAQLVGIWAAKNPHFEGNLAVVRSLGGAKFKRPVSPGELLHLEIEPHYLQGEIEVRGARQIATVRGEKFVASVGGERKAFISSVELAVFPAS